MVVGNCRRPNENYCNFSLSSIDYTQVCHLVMGYS